MLAPSAKRREVSGESHEGWSCILPRTACEADLHKDDSFKRVKLISGVATSREGGEKGGGHGTAFAKSGKHTLCCSQRETACCAASPMVANINPWTQYVPMKNIGNAKCYRSPGKTFGYSRGPSPTPCAEPRVSRDRSGGVLMFSLP